VESLAEDEFIDDDELNLCVGHDGSISARACVKLATEYYLKQKDKVTVDIIHIFDLEKQADAPRNYKRDTITAELKPLDTSYGGRFKLHMIERVKDEKEGKTIVKFTADEEEIKKTVDFLFLGFKGRRKADEKELLASDVSYAIAYSQCSCIVLREEMPIPESGALHYLVPVDLNRWSEKALFDALFLSTPNDKVTVMHVRIREEETAQTEEYYTKIFDRLTAKMKNPPEMKYIAVRHGGEGAAVDILKYAADEGVDMICMGANVDRLRKQESYLGSVHGAVLLGTKLPVCVAHYDETFASVVSKESRPTLFLPDDAPIVVKQMGK
jgi:nucleotide-binding universal stress UspA family protein